MLFSTSLIALVLSPRRLVITNTKVSGVLHIHAKAAGLRPRSFMQRKSTICELTFPTTILGVRLNRKRLVVVLEDFIYLYDISNMKLIHTINTAPNQHGIDVSDPCLSYTAETLSGLCALSPSSDNCYLAYPLPQKAAPSAFTPPLHVPPSAPHQNTASGHVMIFDASSKQAVNVIEAHRAPLSHMAMNRDGTRLATASEKGTIIRVFSIPDAQKLFQFRRGSMPARILSMSFNTTSTLLCVSSATETIHIFKLSATTDVAAAGTMTSFQTGAGSLTRSSVSSGDSGLEYGLNYSDAGATADNGLESRRHNGTWLGMVRRTSQNVSKTFASTVGGYLPTAVSEMLEPARDFAWFKLPRNTASSESLKSVVGFSQGGSQVLVVTSDGQFLVYSIDTEKGGEAALSRQYS